MKFYVTSDNHGSLRMIFEQRMALGLNEDCGLIVMGDAGFNYYNDIRDFGLKQKANSLGFKFYCVRGNHEMRPEKLFHIKKIFDTNVNGIVYMEEMFPNIRYLITGPDCYYINNMKTVVINGAYSVDKYYRLQTHAKWFEDEQINTKEMWEVESALKNNDVSLILSHTCPRMFQPTDLFLPYLDQNMIDNSMEKWMDELARNYKWDYWLFGHYHKDRKITNGVYMLYHTIRPLEDVLEMAGKNIYE